MHPETWNRPELVPLPYPTRIRYANPPSHPDALSGLLTRFPELFVDLELVPNLEAIEKIARLGDDIDCTTDPHWRWGLPTPSLLRFQRRLYERFAVSIMDTDFDLLVDNILRTMFRREASLEVLRLLASLRTVEALTLGHDVPGGFYQLELLQSVRPVWLVEIIERMAALLSVPVPAYSAGTVPGVFGFLVGINGRRTGAIITITETGDGGRRVWCEHLDHGAESWSVDELSNDDRRCLLDMVAEVIKTDVAEPFCLPAPTARVISARDSAEVREAL